MRQNQNSDDEPAELDGEIPLEDGEIPLEEVCTYIAAILDELHKIADKHHICFLSYLIEIARLEALDQQKLNQSSLGYKNLE